MIRARTYNVRPDKIIIALLVLFFPLLGINIRNNAINATCQTKSFQIIQINSLNISYSAL